ncbi:hypothetical protein LEMLEM_LOCUS12843 [Lemmus lemmus]
MPCEDQVPPGAGSWGFHSDSKQASPASATTAKFLLWVL